MVINLDLYILYLILSIMFFLCAIIFFLIGYKRSRIEKHEKIKKYSYYCGKEDKIYHPYVCSSCKYDLIGSVAGGSKNCPECNNLLPYNDIDRMVAKALLATGRVPSNFLIYHFYRPVKNQNKIIFEYVRTVLCETPQVADDGVKRIYGESAIAVSGKMFPKNENGLSLVNPFFVIANPASGLLFRGFGGDMEVSTEDVALQHSVDSKIEIKENKNVT